MENFPSNVSNIHREVKARSDLAAQLLLPSMDVEPKQDMTISVKDTTSHLHSFTLPSLGKFNKGVKQIAMRPLNIAQAMAICEAIEIKDEGEQLLKLATIVESSISGVHALDLTVPDFNAVCYELRLISSDSPILVEKEVAGRKLTHMVVRQSFTTVYIDEKSDVSKFDFPRIRDKIELLRDATRTKFNKVERLFFGYVKGDTPDEKLRNLRDLSYNDFDELTTVYTGKVAHGQSDKLKVYNDDGSYEEMEVQFDIVRLLPFSITGYILGDNI